MTEKEFKLRRPRKKDLEEYNKNKNDKAVDKGFFSFKYPYSKKQAKKDLDKLIKNNKRKVQDVFIIEIKGKTIGEIGLTEIVPKLKAKIHYWLGKEYRGRGITTKAVKKIVIYGFKKYKLRRIFGRVRKDNKASQKVLEKAGFKLEGILRKNFLKHGKYIDDMMYARVKWNKFIQKIKNTLRN